MRAIHNEANSFSPPKGKFSSFRKTSALPSGKAVVWRKEEKLSLGGEKEFASLSMAPQKKFQRTFEIVLPNLIHKARTCLPKKQTVRPKAERKKKI